MMKKMALTLATLFALSACGTTGPGANTDTVNTPSISTSGDVYSMAGQWVMMGGKMYVQNKCTAELQKSTRWRMASLLMSQEQKTERENKICSCVSEEAPNYITAAQLPQLLSEQGRAQVFEEVTAKTVSACYEKLFAK